MKGTRKLSALVGAMAIGSLLGAAVVQEKKEAVFVDSTKAQFKEVVPGVQKAVLWGDHDKGPYGAFTKFDPGVTNALHTHTNDTRIVVIKGAYIYKPEKGEERRVAAGDYLFIPGGNVHVSSGDPKDGALFYEESTGKFDINVIGKPSKQ